MSDLPRAPRKPAFKALTSCFVGNVLALIEMIWKEKEKHMTSQGSKGAEVQIRGKDGGIMAGPRPSLLAFTPESHRRQDSWVRVGEPPWSHEVRNRDE